MELDPHGGSIIRDYSSQDALRSDRSAGDLQRHRQKVRKSIRDNIADLVGEESIIGKSGDKIIKVPIRGVKEYRFIYGENTPGVGQGDGNSQPGQVVGNAQGEKGQGQDKAGEQPGVDYYETDVTLDELIEILFEDLELPFMERKILREVMSERVSKRQGYRKKGIWVRLDKKRTAKNRIKRRMAKKGAVPADPKNPEERFPFHQDDLVYRHMEPDTRPESNAAVICIMDTSGSMDMIKKYLARTFFFLLYRFVLTKYRNVEIVFVAHHTEGREVTEEEFFHKGESGGTFISSGYKKALEIIAERYHPTLWNIYAFHCSDGDNFESDNPSAIKMAEELCEICNFFGYGEIKPSGSRYYESSMLNIFKAVKAANFMTLLIEKKEDLWVRFNELLAKDKKKDAA
ncbi:MAG: sporulation protein YhbH [Candidatus Sungbacteria bacterium]|nr:sporulation protein YhbH [Candidatus Sungbacteria bacterium]